MRKHYLSFLSLLFAAFILLGGRAVLKAQQASSSAVKGGRWSDAATWSDKKVPGKDAVVTIDNGINVVLDVSPQPLNGLTINGKLSFADNKDLNSPPSGSWCTGNWKSAPKPNPTRARRQLPSPTTSKTKILVDWVEKTAVTAGSCSWAEP